VILLDNQQKILWTCNRAILKDSAVSLVAGSSVESILETSDELQITIAGKKISGNGIFEINLVDINKNIVFNEKIIFSSLTNNQKVLRIKSNLKIAKIVLLKTMAQFGKVEILRFQVKKIISENQSIKNNISKKIENQQIETLPDINYTPTNFQNIAIIIPYSIYGGAEVYLKEIFKNIPENFNADFFFLKRNQLSSYLNNYSIKTENLANLQALQLKLLSKKYNCIIYYNSLSVYNFLINLKSKFNLESDLIEIYHSNFRWADSLSSISERRYVKSIFKITDSLCNEINGVKQVTVPIPIDTDVFCNTRQTRKANSKIFGMVARLSAEKDPLYAIDLFKNTPYELRLAGDGPLRAAIEDKIKRENLNNIKLLGHINNIQEFYQDIDALILTSINEGVPISIMEAMANGLSVFTTDVGEIRRHFGEMDGLFYLSKNLEKDKNLIDLFKTSYNENLRDFIILNHNSKKVSNLFFKNIDNSFLWNSPIEKVKLPLYGVYI
jgi:glycosyltransferase involved in cell wall biosynthesis